MQIRIALPSKGRISEPAVKLLGKAGIGVKDTANRRLFSETYDNEISVMFTRAADIPEFVADGAANWDDWPRSNRRKQCIGRNTGRF